MMQEHGAVIPEGSRSSKTVRSCNWCDACLRCDQLLIRRVLGTVAIAWLPLLVLSIHNGLAIHGAALPFLKDIQAQIRMLVSLPLYIVAAHVAHRVITPAMQQLVERGVVRGNEIPSRNGGAK